MLLLLWASQLFLCECWHVWENKHMASGLYWVFMGAAGTWTEPINFVTYSMMQYDLIMVYNKLHFNGEIFYPYT